jgi:DNA polymerase I
MMIGQQHFDEATVADFEFSQLPGEQPTPVCLVARELVSGRVHRIFQPELLAMRQPPYPTGSDCLFVAYYASAEIDAISRSAGPFPTIFSTSLLSSAR